MVGILRVASVLTLTSLVLMGCQAQSGAADPERAAAGASLNSGESIAGTSATLVVYGMGCPLCANNVDKQLLSVPGVTGVKVDMATGEASLTLDGSGRTTRQMLADAIDRSGFSLRDVRIP